ncbi:hypothetical protein, variant 1 [Aphanomyces invadans]|nr:hypothetical protein, variant 1 [Aphanomyces invadans]ETW07025.1 hypothetical protein, variant 1 [Aphanomyces invadans]|eukprot:XP_008865100.1 hypothetical protein, variant 1 [Aphanomyces invadans]
MEVISDDAAKSTTPATLTKAQKKKNRKMAKKKADGHVVSTAVSLSSGAQTVALPTYPIVRLDHHADHIPRTEPVVPSPDAQRHIVRRLLEQYKEHGMTVGDRYFVVSFKWWESWCNYVRFYDVGGANGSPSRSGGFKPPSIDNHHLLDASTSELLDGTVGSVLCRELVEHVHFILQPQEVWDAFVAWYGGGPPICRFVVQVGDPSKSTLKRVELYPNDPAGSDSDVDMGAEAEVEGGGCTEPAQDAAAGHSGHTPQRYARPERCMVCHRPSTNRCGHCKHCMYCSKACQLAHWKYHKPHCARIKGTVAVSAVDIHGRQGQAGLRNLGNTCFMNAALQCLSHTTALTFHFLTNSYQTDLNTDNVLGTGGKLATQYALLLKELWLGTASSVSPGPLKRAIGTFAPQFSGYQQHDAQELLAYLLDGLHEDVNRITKKPYVQVQDSNGTEPDAVVAATAWRHHKLRNESIVVDTLHGQFKSTVVCPHCDKVSITFDPFNCVQLELPHAVTRSIEVIVMPKLTRESVESANDAAALRPLKYGVHVHKRGNVKAIKMAVVEAGCPYTSLVMCDVFQHLVYRILPDDERMARIRPDDRLVVYPQPPKTAQCVLFCYHRGYKRGGAGLEPTLVGDPLMLSLNRQTTFEAFLEQVLVELVPLFGWTPAQAKQRLDDPTLQLCLASHMFVTNQDGVKAAAAFMADADGFGKHALVMSTLQLSDAGYVGIDWDGDMRLLYQATEPFILPHRSLDTIQARATHGLTLADCFQKFTSAEQLDEDNLWYCSNCKQHRQATKTMQLYALPDILILSLKRFEYRNDVVRDKLDVLVDFPVEGLDMAPYCLSAAPDHASSLIYDLYATTNHFGSMGFGHYTAFAKDHATNLWYNFDDSAVTSVSAASVVSNAAYILFYKRRAPSPTPRL